MTGRHAAPPDEAFDQRERDRAGSHRAEIADPQGEIGDGSVPADADLQPVPAAAPAKKPPAKKPAAKKPPATKAPAKKTAAKPATSKKAGTS
jgi:hypothetical protein